MTDGFLTAIRNLMPKPKVTPEYERTAASRGETRLVVIVKTDERGGNQQIEIIKDAEADNVQFAGSLTALANFVGELQRQVEKELEKAHGDTTETNDAAQAGDAQTQDADQTQAEG